MELQMWKEILTPYDLAVEELKVKFNHIVKEYQQMNGYSPIEQVLGRVKSISSIIDKAQKKGIDMDKIETQLEDIAGIRLISSLQKIFIQLQVLSVNAVICRLKVRKTILRIARKADTAVIISLYYIRWKPFAGRKKSRSRFRFVHWV